MAIVGDAAGNLLIGTLAGDEVLGLGGDDTIRGRSGADAVSGGSGDDRISGGEGGDTLRGDAGDDVIFGFGPADAVDASASIVVRGVGPASFERPVFATAAPGDPDRLYVVEQHIGRILILDARTGAVNPEPFLDIPDDVLARGGEQGLLGLAFHPGYAANGRFFVYLTRADGDVVVRSYRRSADPDRAGAGSADPILVIDKDNGATNHNGGWMGFGPDGMLYVAVGDEGASGDPANNAQNTGVLWGKMLRVDVGGDAFPGNTSRDYVIPADNPFVGAAGADEIWALGLRNPWRASFDRVTGHLFIGDVGQGAREEIDVQPAGGSGGVNYGWKVKEGTAVFNDSVPGNPSPDSPLLVDPVAEYGHDAAGGFAVVGGYVYRGGSPGMQGRYLFADFVSDRLWSFRYVDGRAADLVDHTDQLVLAGGSFDGITSFAEDGRGNVYGVGIGGAVSRLDFGAGSADGADFIAGGDGDDRLYGGAGRDTIYGGRDDDALAGGGQGDILRGGAGSDRIAGGPGNDWLDGGADSDALIGGRGSDTFLFKPLSATHTIADFQDDQDTIRLSGFGLDAAADALDFAENVNGDVVFTFAGGQVLTVVGTTIAGLADDLVV